MLSVAGRTAFRPASGDEAAPTRPDALEDARAVSGRVVDEQGRPIPNVRVSCTYLYAPGGQQIPIRRMKQDAPVTTDPDGRFKLDLSPGELQPGRWGADLPPSTVHHLRFWPPLDPEGPPDPSDTPPTREFELAEHYVSNAGPVTIVLKRPTIDRAVELQQEDGTWVGGPEPLKYIAVMREPTAAFDPPSVARTSVFHLQSSLRQNGRASFVPGRYFFGATHATVTATQDSPDPIRVPKLHRTACTGRVVDAVTGEPLAGALVITSAGYSPGNRIAGLTPQEWDALEAMPRQPAPDEPAMWALKPSLTEPRVVKTDADGRYHIHVPDGAVLTNNLIYAAARNRIVDAVRNEPFAEEPGVVNELPDLLLAPSATVEVNAFSSARGETQLHWKLADEAEQPAWARAFEAATHRSEVTLHGWHRQRIDIEGIEDEWEALPSPRFIYKVLVPAGVDIRLYFPWQRTVVKDSIEMHFADSSRVPRRFAVGEVVRLPPIRFHRGVPVRVRAVDESGQPAEGAPVKCVRPDRPEFEVHNADADGWVMFEVNPADGASFAVDGCDLDFLPPFPAAPLERRVVLPPFEEGEVPGPITLTLTAKQEAALRGDVQ